VKYASAAAFRQALEERLKNEAASIGLALARLRKRVTFELFLRRLLIVAPDRWVLKGALALDFRLAIATRRNARVSGQAAPVCRLGVADRLSSNVGLCGTAWRAHLRARPPHR
jgi:hypothetical protein